MTMPARAVYTWEAPVLTTSESTPSNTDAIKSLVIMGASGTIRRMIVDVYLQMPAATDGTFILGRIGIIVADARTVAAGISAFPLPATNADQEWLWNRGYFRRIDVEGAVSDTHPLHLHDDVRGMRQFKQSDELVAVIENESSGTILWVPHVRVLFST